MSEHNGHAKPELTLPTITVGKPDHYNRSLVDSFDDKGELVHSGSIDLDDPFRRQKYIERLEQNVGAARGSLAGLDLLLVKAARDAAKGTGAAMRELERISSSELASNDYEVSYLIDNVLPAGVPTVIGGRFKSLKTTIAEEMAIARVSGKKFLNHFEVLEPGRTGIISCESGLGTLKETAQRICRSKFIDLKDLDGLVWSSSVPRIPEDVPAIERFCRNDELSMLIIDPLYLLVGDAASSAGNVYAMGNFFQAFTELIKNTGITLVLVHHCKKGRGEGTGKYDQPELAELAQAGIAEYVRSWCLVGPMAEYDPDNGRHRLWLNVGGSAGHSGLYGLDVTEGRRPDRVWCVQVTPASDVRKEREKEVEQQKAKRAEATENEQRRKLFDALKLHPNGETKSVLREEAGLSAPAFGTAIRTLMKEGRAIVCEVEKSGRNHDAFKLCEPSTVSTRNQSESVGITSQHSDSESVSRNRHSPLGDASDCTAPTDENS